MSEDDPFGPAPEQTPYQPQQRPDAREGRTRGWWIVVALILLAVALTSWLAFEFHG